VLPKGIGDVVYGLALAEGLKQAHPALEITWVVQPLAAPLLTGHPALRRVIVYAPSGGWAALRTLRNDLRSERFDLAINLGMYLHSLPPFLLARSKRKVGFDSAYAKDGLPWFCSETIAAPRGAHVMDLFLAAQRYLGVQEPVTVCRLPLLHHEIRLCEELATRHPERPIVVMVPCSGREEKDWPAARYGELARRLQAEWGAQVLVVGGTRDREARAAEEICRCAPGTEVSLGDDLRRLFWVLKAAHLLVAPDTGPLHLARALGTPLVGLYGHTDPRRYGPYVPFAGQVIDRYHFDGPGVASAWNGVGGRSGRMSLISVDEVEEASFAALSLGSRFISASRDRRALS
jgi:heptosyltransferase I